MTDNQSIIQFLVTQIRLLVVMLNDVDLTPVFGVYISIYDVYLSLFVLSMILLYLSGEGEGDD